MNILIMALIPAIITAVILVANKLLHGQSPAKSLAVAPVHFILSYIVYATYLYVCRPALVGLMGGYGVLLIWVLAYTSGAGWLSFYNSNHKDKNPVSAKLPILAAGGIVLWLVINFIVYCSVTWGTENVTRFANLAHVEVAKTTETLPPTDPNHIVMVPQDVAAFMGQQVIGNPADNLGSIYMTEPSSYTLQSIKGHLYWVAPLVYRNAWGTQLGLFTTQISTSPGYISVDAEDPNGEVKLHTGYKMRYMPCAIFNQDLERHIYLSGYTKGELDDVTFEVDDNWRPFFTASYLKPKFAVAGRVIDKLILVDGETGEVKALEVDKAPKWIDRVMSADLVDDYALDWGRWSDKRSSGCWPNFNSQYQMKPVDFELLYNSHDKPVWVVPMTSNNGSNASSTGIMIYDSHDNNAIFYPGLSGLGTGDNVKHAFENSPKNITRRQVDSVQLYQINGVPTWVAIYTQPQGDHGSSFAAIGMLEARHLNGANVVFAEDKRTALADYANALAAGDGNTQDVSRVGQCSKKITGTIARMGSQMLNQQTVYIMTIHGSPLRFTATAKTSELLPLMREGDIVNLTYLDTKEPTEAVISIDDESLKAKPATK